MKSRIASQVAAADSDIIMYLRQVVKLYDDLGGTVTALSGIDLHLRRGEFLVIMGKSGSGKTTLINCITGLDRCTSGEIHVESTAVHALNPEQAARWRRTNLGVVFQSFELMPTLSALENVMLPMDFAGSMSLRRQSTRAMELLESFEIAEHAQKTPAGLSGGQQQRLAIARAMANNPPILVADEPTGSLDSATAETVMRIFESLVRNGKTILLVTHDADVAAHGTRQVTISDGHLVDASARGASHA
jgi:putative ABC transport system ATP-binding protein